MQVLFDQNYALDALIHSREMDAAARQALLSTVEAGRLFQQTPHETAAALEKKFGLSPEESMKYVKEHWDA